MASDQGIPKYFPLLDLPAELRIQVYRFMLLTTYDHQWRRLDFWGVPNICKRELAILQTCKQIHSEATEIWRYENTWIHVELPETAALLLHLDRVEIASQRGIISTTPPTLKIRLESPRWKNDKVYTLLGLPESLDMVRSLWVIFCKDPNCFKDLSLRLTVGGRYPVSATCLLETFTSVSGFQSVSIEGDLEEQYRLDFKSRMEEPWTAQDAMGAADLLRLRAEHEYESGCFQRAYETTRDNTIYVRYMSKLYRHNCMANGVNLDLTIARTHKANALRYIIAAFRAQHYRVVCGTYTKLGNLLQQLSSFERGWISCCAAISDVDKQLTVIGGQEHLTLESAIEAVDNDKDLKQLLRWLNNEIWADEFLVGHPSYIEFSKLREGYNVWLSIVDEEAAKKLLHG
ncbi:hypothetical protein MMC11_005958 [Xylographa trunciseda]|nr:hypothetical protein [Xylographa trunciseda]